MKKACTDAKGSWQVQCHELSEDDRDETKRCEGRPRHHEATGDRKGRANRLQAKPPPEHLLMSSEPGGWRDHER
jgi:hypothetical protein